MDNATLISCICITNNSTSSLKRAINCFKSQTYSNKELVVLFESDNLETKNFLLDLEDPQILMIEINHQPKLTLGELRNIAINKSNGEYFCQWDDDDWYSADRLEYQMSSLRLNYKSVCMLTYWIMFDSLNRQAYLSPFRLWEGSILSKKSILNDYCNYAPLEKSEDTYLLEKLIEHNLVYPIIKPNLYIYNYHGYNTWNFEHFNKFYKEGKKLSKNLSLSIQSIMNESISNAEANKLMNSEMFLSELDYRFRFIDNYKLSIL